MYKFTTDKPSNEKPLTKQSKLDSFFMVKSNPNSVSRRCFIYNPTVCDAFFANVPDQNMDTFIACKNNIKLYLRKSDSGNGIGIVPPLLPNVLNTCKGGSNVPLLKSNLQKAIRRFETSVALNSALLLLQLDPVQLIRRLPIIYIEDVCLIDSLPVLIWFLMADKDYVLTLRDKWHIIGFVKNLCEVRNMYYPNDEKVEQSFTHEQLITETNSDCLLAIYYRSLWGGMPGDMRMLQTSIRYYIDNPDKIVKRTLYTYDELLTELESGTEVHLTILDEAIDFHPFPKMLTMLLKRIEDDYELPPDITGDTIKKYIWFCESGINYRKPLTIEKRDSMVNDELWSIIVRYLSDVRSALVF